MRRFIAYVEAEARAQKRERYDRLLDLRAAAHHKSKDFADLMRKLEP